MNLFPVTEEEKKEILKQYNITETQIKENVEIIKEWKEKVPHLPATITGLILKQIEIRFLNYLCF